MEVAINQPVGFTEVGQRSNNEDYVYPPLDSVSTSTRLFLVCDGVGGQHKGEVASELACKSIQSFFDQNPTEATDENYIKRALAYTVDRFTKTESEDRETAGMATTLTLLHFNEAGATIAHLGDSRIYQVRNGKVIRVSQDHKLVNELVRDGHITETEALAHSQRNVITKVISADRNDLPDVKIINDVKDRDYFFLCTDGVLEQLYDDLLAYHLREGEDNNVSDSQKIENIRQECLGKTRDNFSAYLVGIKMVSGELLMEHTVAFPAVDITSELPVAEPVRMPDFRNGYEMDSPTQFTRPTGRKLNDFDSSQTVIRQNLPRKKKGTVKKTKLLPYVIGIFTGVLVTFAAFRYWQQMPDETTGPAKVIEIPQAVTEAPVIESERANLPVAEDPEIPERTSKKINFKVPNTIYDTIAHSKRGNFYIFSDGKNYFTWEPARRKKTLILYDEIVSEGKDVHFYSFKGSGNFYLFLEKPDVKISGIDHDKPVESKGNEIIYTKDGIEHRIDPNTGDELNRPVDALK